MCKFMYNISPTAQQRCRTLKRVKEFAFPDHSQSSSADGWFVNPNFALWAQWMTTANLHVVSLQGLQALQLSLLLKTVYFVFLVFWRSLPHGFVPFEQLYRRFKYLFLSDHICLSSFFCLALLWQ